MGDVAQSWTVSPDGLTYEFKLRDNVRFHEARVDVSRRKGDLRQDHLPAGGRGERAASVLHRGRARGRPGPGTVVFHLKYPQAGMLANLASPWNYLYKADILEQDPRWYEKNIMGTGPFRFVEYVPGSHWVGKRNEDYFVPSKPYLDGFRAIFIRDTSAQVAAVRGGRAAIEFRGFAPPARDDVVRTMGKDVVVQESAWGCSLYVVPSTRRASRSTTRACAAR